VKSDEAEREYEQEQEQEQKQEQEQEQEVQLCFQCGSMIWIQIFSGYTRTYHVREDGRVEFEEDFDSVETTCNKCGSWCLLGVVGARKVFRELAALDPAERILRALGYLCEKKLKEADGESATPDDILKWLDCYTMRKEIQQHQRRHEKEEEGERSTGSIDFESFKSRARDLIATWKLLDGD
jgi:hypothetical protein